VSELKAATHLPEARLKKRAATISLAYNIVLTLLKLAGALLTGSVSLLSEAIHSATDIIASGIALLSVRAAAAPPDEEHPYGHGKIESLAGFAESILLLMTVGYVVYESIQRLLRNSAVENMNLGIWIMGFSVVSSFLVGRHVQKIADETGSMALASNGQHLMVDFWTSLGVLAALLVTKLTGWAQADSYFAMALAAWLALGAYRLSHEAFQQLIDRRLEDSEIEKVREMVHEHPGILSFHRLRSRMSGTTRYIEFHVVVPAEWSVVEAHDCVDVLEKKIAEALQPAVVVIHVDPYDPAKAKRKATV